MQANTWHIVLCCIWFYHHAHDFFRRICIPLMIHNFLYMKTCFCKLALYLHAHVVQKLVCTASGIFSLLNACLRTHILEAHSLCFTDCTFSCDCMLWVAEPLLPFSLSLLHLSFKHCLLFFCSRSHWCKCSLATYCSVLVASARCSMWSSIGKCPLQIIPSHLLFSSPNSFNSELNNKILVCLNSDASSFCLQLAIVRTPPQLEAG